jgi:hypothetical protein
VSRHTVDLWRTRYLQEGCERSRTIDRAEVAGDPMTS